MSDFPKNSFEEFCDALDVFKKEISKELEKIILPILDFLTNILNKIFR